MDITRIVLEMIEKRVDDRLDAIGPRIPVNRAVTRRADLTAQYVPHRVPLVVMPELIGEVDESAGLHHRHDFEPIA